MCCNLVTDIKLCQNFDFDAELHINITGVTASLWSVMLTNLLVIIVKM